MSATDKAVLGGTAGVGGVAATTAALNSGGGDAGPTGATGADGGATGTATNTAGGAKGAPSKPSVYSETMDGALGDWGGIGKGINEVSNTLGADFLIDKILGEGQAAQMHPLLKVLLLAGGGMGIGGLLSGNNKMGLGGLGLAALPLLFQGTKGFGMMGGNKAAPDIGTSGVTYTPNETLDDAWADKKLSAEEYNKLLKDPTALASAISHDDFGSMAQQIINQTATRDSSGAHKPSKDNPTMGDNLVSLGYRSGGLFHNQIAEALQKPKGTNTELFNNKIPGMGLSPEQAQLMMQKLKGMQAGTPTYDWNNVSVANTPPAANKPTAQKQPNRNTTNLITNTGL